MGNYRPRPVQVISCKHCSILFETRHKRTIYCGESCRQLAYQARHRNDGKQGLGNAKNNLSFSMQNVGVVTTGAAAVAVGNYLLNDYPAQQEILSKLSSIEKGTEEGLNQLLGAAQLMIDYVNVQVQNDFKLKGQIDQLRVKRNQDEIQRKLRKQQTLAKLLSRRS